MTPPLLTAGMAVSVLFGFAALFGVWWLAQKTRRRLRELQAQDELMSRRCDELTARLETLEHRRRIDHLRDLVRSGTHGGRLDEETGERLLGYLDELDGDGSS